MERLSRQELIEEIQQKDELISQLKSELDQYRTYLHNRKIAISAPETQNDSELVLECNNYYKDQK